MNEALILIDFINEIAGVDGKIAQTGYGAFISRHGTLQNAADLIEWARKKGIQVVHVRLGFFPNYRDMSGTSPLFKDVEKLGILQMGTASTELCKEIEVRSEDRMVVKTRVSAFCKTQLDRMLKEMGADTLIIAGVATDLAVSSAVREAHDLDYKVIVVSDCCAAASDAEHESELAVLKKIAAVKTLSELMG
jgi:nicotinamidase-related amidase